MGIVALKCPGCKGEIQLDDSKEFGFCMYCGNKFMVKDEIQRVELSGKVKIDNSETLENCLNLANDAYISNNYLEAYNYYTKVLEIKNDEYKAIYRKALCAGYLSSAQNSRTDEVVNGFKKAFEILSNDTETISVISKELFGFVTEKFQTPKKQVGVFKNLSDCENYFLPLINGIMLLDRIHPIIPTEAEEHKKNLLSHLILLCDSVAKSNFRYIAGMNGNGTPRYETYNIKNKTGVDVAAIKKTAVDSFNNLSYIQENS